VKISFDPAKRKRNLAKHGLDLADGAEVLAGRCLDRLDDRRDYDEDRWLSIGTLRGTVVACAWAEAGEDEPRIISLRKADKDEEEDWFRTYGD
jgi:uncharacterized protein